MFHRRISIVMLILIIFLFLPRNVYCSDNWIDFAYQYAELNDLMNEHGNDELFVNYHDMKKQVEDDFKTLPQPEIAELEEMISSQDENDQLIATIGIMLSGIYNDFISEKLIDIYRNTTSFKLRTYVTFAFRVVPLLGYEDAMLDAVLQLAESNELINGLVVISRFNPEKTSKVYTEIFLKNKNFVNRLIAYSYLKKNGEKYADKALDDAAKRGDNLIVEIVTKLDNKEITGREAYEKYHSKMKERD